MSILKNTQTYMPRVIDEEIERELSRNGAVCINGPRRCGKTTTAEYHGESGLFLTDPVQSADRLMAETSPALVLGRKPPEVLDEWQDVPALWDEVTSELGRSKETGRYILTGSASPRGLKGERCKPGQIKSLTMRTMSLYETGDSTGAVSLRALCDGRLSPCDTGEVGLKDLVRLMVRGGWPDSLDPHNNSSMGPDDYVSAIISQDVRNIRDDGYIMNEMRILLHSLARHEAGTPSIETIVKDVLGETGVNDRTVLENNVIRMNRYLNFYDELYLFDNTTNYSFSPNPDSPEHLGSDITRYFCDVSLACSLLGIVPSDNPGREYVNTVGHLFESLCVHDLKVYAQSFGAKVFHYRENRNRTRRSDAERLQNRGEKIRDANNGEDDEIDAVIELPGKETCAFEMKLGAEQIEKASRNLLRIQDNIRTGGGTPPQVLCVICGLTDKAYQRDDGVFVVPVTALKP